MTQFAFVPESLPIWEHFCTGIPFVNETPAPYEDLYALHELGVWGIPGERMPTAGEANQACANYAAYRTWQVN